MNFDLSTIRTWLRAGYPEGVPQHDYVALYGVLQRHLTEDEMVTLTDQIHEHDGADVSEDEVRRHIEGHLKGSAYDEDVRRVASRLAAGGWPLA